MDIQKIPKAKKLKKWLPKIVLLSDLVIYININLDFICYLKYFINNQRKLMFKQKSRMRETPTLSTDADSRTDTNLKRLRDFFFFNWGGGRWDQMS